MNQFVKANSSSFLISIALLWPFLAFAETTGRSIYLNGVDISNARNQTLKKVDIRIDEHGHIFIDAPHYKAHEENQFIPLSSWFRGSQHSVPEHKPRGKLPDAYGRTLPQTHAPAAGSGPIDNKLPTAPPPNQQDPAPGIDKEKPQ